MCVYSCGDGIRAVRSRGADQIRRGVAGHGQACAYAYAYVDLDVHGSGGMGRVSPLTMVV